LEALAENSHIIFSRVFVDGEVLKTALEKTALRAGVLFLMLAHQLAKRRRGDQAVGLIAALEQLAEHVPGAAAYVQNPDRAGLRGR